MYSLDHPMHADDSEVSLRIFLRDAQRQVQPAQVLRRRQALRQILASYIETEQPRDEQPQEQVPEREPEQLTLYLHPGAQAG